MASKIDCPVSSIITMRFSSVTPRSSLALINIFLPVLAVPNGIKQKVLCLKTWAKYSKGKQRSLGASLWAGPGIGEYWGKVNLGKKLNFEVQPALHTQWPFPAASLRGPGLAIWLPYSLKPESINVKKKCNVGNRYHREIRGVMKIQKNEKLFCLEIRQDFTGTVTFE